MLAWPHPDSDWRETYASVWRCYSEIFRRLSDTIELWVLLHPSVVAEFTSGVLPLAKYPVKIFEVEYNDTWVRDYGPLSLESGLVNFRFNAWGDKFDARLDDSVHCQLSEKYGMSFHQQEIVVEGGALEINGKGVLLANRDCLIDTKRNALSEAQMREHLQRSLGVTDFALIRDICLSGDDTDGHIDTLARFVRDDLLLFTDVNPQHPDREVLCDLRRQLQKLAAARNWQLLGLPTPSVSSALDGRPLPATYANFLICNRHIYLPVYGVPEDDIALKIMRQNLPEFQIEGLRCEALLEQHGSLHCATMQITSPD